MIGEQAIGVEENTMVLAQPVEGGDDLGGEAIIGEGSGAGRGPNRDEDSMIPLGVIEARQVTSDRALRDSNGWIPRRRSRVYLGGLLPTLFLVRRV